MMKSLPSREGILVLTLAAAAALRVFLFASAFPFFTNVDEHRHVDLVLKYARGYAPLPGSDAYEPEVPGLLARYGSPEYHVHDERFRERGVAPPSWQRDPAEVRRQIEANTAYFARRPNMEAYQPPLYYAIAGGWLAFGRAIGVEGGALLYWVRQLNAVFAEMGVAELYANGIHLNEGNAAGGLESLGFAREGGSTYAAWTSLVGKKPYQEVPLSGKVNNAVNVMTIKR